jgi:hypothetical protein
MPETSLLERLTADTLNAALMLRDAELSALSADIQKKLRAENARGARIAIEIYRNAVGDARYELVLIGKDGERKPITATTRATQ